MGIFRKSSVEEELIELPFIEEEKEKVTIRIEKFGGLGDVERIAKLVRKGNIVFLKTQSLQKKDLGQFQTGVQKLKKYCDTFGWDIVGTEEGYLIIAPSFAKIERS